MGEMINKWWSPQTGSSHSFSYIYCSSLYFFVVIYFTMISNLLLTVFHVIHFSCENFTLIQTIVLTFEDVKCAIQRQTVYCECKTRKAG